MKRMVRLISIVLVLLGMSLPTVTQAQTPIPTSPPKLELKWLYSLAVSPATASAGTKFTGTVKLMRAAFSDMKVGLGLVGAQAVEGAGFVLDGVIMPVSVTVPKGSAQATFTVTSSSSVTWTGSKTFTAEAYLGSEKKTTSFTVTRYVK